MEKEPWQEDIYENNEEETRSERRKGKALLPIVS